MFISIQQLKTRYFMHQKLSKSVDEEQLKVVSINEIQQNATNLNIWVSWGSAVIYFRCGE